ncbi:vWA domain-containing protein [Gorillibacterium sp. sgz5001074]|uniref:vWA domain-containing protein n=1 Tax=Gorillibacterium sp. sgz5001074 TaxID=3446695 RepID=UPI003F66EECD
MGFESVSGLWLGLSLPVILLFYLLKRKYADTPVSSHLLWNRVLKEMEANRPWQKLRSRLLMLLQLLAALLAVLGVAGWFIRLEGAAGGSAVYVLDASASMAAVASVESSGNATSPLTRLEAAKHAILRHAERSGSDSFSLVLLGEEPEVLLSRETERKKLETAMAGIEPVPGKPAYKEALSLGASLAAESGGRLYFATDGQWAEGTESLGLQVPPAVLRVQGKGDASVGIVRFSAARAALGASGASGPEAGSQAMATVRNWGSEPATAEASIYAENRLVSVEKTALSPGEDRVLTFPALPAASWYRLSLRAEPDGLNTDNEAFAFPPGGAKRTVWLVSPGNLFLEKALLLAGADVVKLQRTETGYAQPRTPADLVVLDGISPEDSSLSGIRKLLEEKPVWSIGAERGKAGSAKAGSAPRIRQHPVLRYVGWDQVHVAEAVPLSDTAGLEPVVSSGEVPLVLAGGDSGKRRLVFTFALEESDLALRPDFPILTRNAVEWMTAEAGDVLGSGVAGEAVEASWSPRSSSARWELVEGAGTDAAMPETLPGTEMTVKLPDRPGLYRLTESDAEGRTVRSRLAAVAADLKESDLRLAPELDFWTGNQGNSSLGNTEGTGPEDAARRRIPMTAWLAAAMLAVLFWEWEVYRRGHTG